MMTWPSSLNCITAAAFCICASVSVSRNPRSVFGRKRSARSSPYTLFASFSSGAIEIPYPSSSCDSTLYLQLTRSTYAMSASLPTAAPYHATSWLPHAIQTDGCCMRMSHTRSPRGPRSHRSPPTSSSAAARLRAKCDATRRNRSSRFERRRLLAIAVISVMLRGEETGSSGASAGEYNISERSLPYSSGSSFATCSMLYECERWRSTAVSCSNTASSSISSVSGSEEAAGGGSTSYKPGTEHEPCCNLDS
mmetsp:Transcript_3473/g.7533  ORF Transcript_3473/g.7533 Transcript_3473/m.7533 type:complete len:251 (+) Transcript_3473:193-945(+)